MPTATMIAGDWSACLLGLWGPVEISINRDEPGLFAKGTIQMRVFVSCDVAVTTPGAFNVASSIT